MARGYLPGRAGAALVAVAALGLALPGVASAEGPNLTLLLPAREETALHGLSPFARQAISYSNLELSGCDATPVEGMRENMERPPLPGTIAANRSISRVILYRFNSTGDASAYMDCIIRLVNESNQSKAFSRRPASYGDLGLLMELSPGAPQGTSVLYRKGAVVVSVDALDNSFESATAHAFARLIEQKLNATMAAPAKSPGFEAAAALAALVATTWVWRRRAP